MDLRVGDVIEMSCDRRTVHVASVSSDYVFLKFPWSKIDTSSRMKWDGTEAFPVSLDSIEWKMTPFRFERDPSSFSAGDEVTIFVPQIRAYVMRIYECDPPRDIGKLPRPERVAHLLNYGEQIDPGVRDEDIYQGFGYNIPGDEFIEITVVFRPYSSLNPGDVVVDKEGARRNFSPPWHFLTENGQTHGVPEWPLTLASPNNDNNNERAIKVYKQTSVGAHNDEIVKWSAFSGVSPDRFSRLTRPR